MGKYNWGFDLPDSFWTSQLKLNAIQLSNAASELSRVWESTLAGCDFGGIFAAAKQFAAISKSFSDMALSIESLWKQNDIFNTLQTVNVSDAFKNVDWSWVINAYTEAFRGEEDEEYDVLEKTTKEAITPEIRAEMAADITQVLSEPESMCVASRNKYLNWAKKSPEHALLFLGTLIALIGLILQALSFGVQVWEACVTKESHVYEQPSSTSTVVYNLTVENNVTVIGDEPYYYEIEFVNPETGEPITGYVYKGNITVEEQTEMESAEESEATEASEAISDASTGQTGQAE